MAAEAEAAREARAKVVAAEGEQKVCFRCIHLITSTPLKGVACFA